MSPLKRQGQMQLVSVTDEPTDHKLPITGMQITPDPAPSYMDLVNPGQMVWFGGHPRARVYRFSFALDETRSWVWRCAALSCLTPPADHPDAGYQIGRQTWAEAIAALDLHIRTRHGGESR